MKNLTAMLLQSTSTLFGSLTVRNVSGRVYYAHGAFSFPASRAETYTLNANAAGVSFGTGSTPPSEDDVNLEETITDNVTVTLTNRVAGCDGPGNPYLQYTFTITNIGSDPLVIREVCYKQSLKCATTPGRANTTDAVCLLDRTVLDTPLEIASNDAAVLIYKLKTNPQPTDAIGGIEIVSFEWGTDAQIAAMLDAARNGTIDLQRDAHWHVGNMRKIHIDAFTGGGDTAHDAQDIDMVISSFEDYNGCGCILQFDFLEGLAAGQRMHSSNASNYGESEMKTVTLPALVEALPGWLKDRLLPFDVFVGSSSGATTVTGNKLALRAEIEVTGSTAFSYTGEGSRCELYKLADWWRKAAGYAGSNGNWWLRSPWNSSGGQYCVLNRDGGNNASLSSTKQLLAPFGCI